MKIEITHNSGTIKRINVEPNAKIKQTIDVLEQVTEYFKQGLKSHMQDLRGGEEHIRFEQVEEFNN